MSVGGVLTFTGAVSNERYLQVQANLASDTARQNTPIVGEVDLTYQITSTLPSIKYYYLGSQRVAMRGGNEVYYLHGDHLGSTSLTTNITGTVVAQTRHHPFGEVRWESGSRVTDFGFTGQRNEVSFGLMDYKARFYSAGLGRFVSADSIVPDFGNSQGLNRYSYVYNNPLKFVDPTGHCTEGEDNYEQCLEIARGVAEKYGYSIEEMENLDWSYGQELLATDGWFGGGNDLIGWQVLSFGENVVLVDNQEIYEIWDGPYHNNNGFFANEYTKRALVRYSDGSGNTLNQFIHFADAHANAQIDYRQNGYDVVFGSVGALVGVGVAFVGFVSEPTPIVEGIALIGAGYSAGVAINSGIKLIDAKDSIYSNSVNAGNKFRSFIDPKGINHSYVLAVDLDGN